MHHLQKYLVKLKRELERKKEERKNIEVKIRKVMKECIGNDQIMAYIKAWHVEKKVLYIETTSKVVAQEIYWRSEKLKEKINQPRDLIKKIKII